MGASDDEMRPEAPFDDFGLVAACRRLHAAIDKLDETAARAIDISRNDLRCINLLEAGPRAPSDLAQALGLTRGSVTTLLDRLEAKGFVERIAHPTDRRALLVKLQPKVSKNMAGIYRPFGVSLVELANDYGEDVATILAQQLTDIADRCEQAATTTID
ncbi:MAG: MarR family transcriptional regulator [Pseudomonadota bacterium]